MDIDRRFARYATVVLTALLFFGTLMPGRWKDAATTPFDSPLNLAAMAHVAMFAAICFMLSIARFWTLKPWHVPAAGLALALLTEGLQFLAIDRHPNMAGVYQDMLGALVGWALHGRLCAPMAAAPAEREVASSEPGARRSEL